MNVNDERRCKTMRKWQAKGYGYLWSGTKDLSKVGGLITKSVPCDSCDCFHNFCDGPSRFKKDLVKGVEMTQMCQPPMSRKGCKRKASFVCDMRDQDLGAVYLCASCAIIHRNAGHPVITIQEYRAKQRVINEAMKPRLASAEPRKEGEE